MGVRRSMLPHDKINLLKSFLGALPGQSATRLASAVEIDRLMDGHALPHSDILDSLRPTLCRDQATRTFTPLRLFCRPFQDLLTGAERRGKQKGEIARASIVPVWNWLSRALLADASSLYFREAKSLILAGRIEAALARAAQFWPLAGAVMRDALAEGAARRAAEEALGGAAVAQDAWEMALLLSVGEAVEQLAVILPRGCPAFTEQLVWRVREIYSGVAAQVPDAAPYVAVAAMNRLAKPWEALRLPLLVTRKVDETLIAKTDLGLVGEILFARMETLKSDIERTRHPLFDATLLMEQVKVFTSLSSNIVKEMEIKRGGDWGKKLLAERALVGGVMDGFMDRAVREVSAALPTAKGTGADFSRQPGAEKHEMALRYARLVVGCRNFAAAASFAAKQKAVYEELCVLLQRYNDDIVKALKLDPHNMVAIAQLQLCTELTALLFSDEEAEFLRRRAKAALAAA